MLYYKINYYHNRLFFIKDDYYIYIYDIFKPEYKYNFKIMNDDIWIEILNNKNIDKHKIKFKILNNNNEINLEYELFRKKTINIGKLENFIFTKSENIVDEDIKKSFPKFDIEYYLQNNKLININHDITFIKYHWYLCGQYHPYHYFKYLLKKYEGIIFNLNTSIISYDENKNNTLLFIDDRYDYSFIYLLKLFIYSVEETWNITVFTTDENKELYENDFTKLNITGKINIIDKFNSIDDYNNLLKDSNFWKLIKEENVLLFQYDSFCMGKFNNIFFNYNYIGARWPHDPFKCNIRIGNGGTSFRKTRVMERICKKYMNKEAEDLFFSYYLHQENLNNCYDRIADMFSFENIYIEDSIYAHQIYNTIKLEDLDNFVYSKLIKL